MARNVIEFEGIQELLEGLKVNADLDDVKRVVRVNGAELQKRAQRNAPYQFGALQRSINLRITNLGYTARVSTNVHYAGYQEYGTRYIYPKQYMWSAFYRSSAKFKTDLQRLMKG